MSVARADCDDRVARAQLHDDKPEPPLLRLGPLRATHKEQHRSQEAGGPYGQGEKRIVDEETGQLDYGREALPRAAPTRKQSECRGPDQDIVIARMNMR